MRGSEAGTRVTQEMEFRANSISDCTVENLFGGSTVDSEVWSQGEMRDEGEK